jgi:6-phosphogluconate dehydrogenase
MNEIAIIGLAPMGKNLAKNFASRGISVGVYNRSFVKTRELISENNPNITGYEEIADLIKNLERPRKVIIMIRSGFPVEEMLVRLQGLLEENDIIIDCGNSNWQDTSRRQHNLLKNGIHFVGCGVSGGTFGALNGPSIMPGGDKEALENIMPILKKIAAKDFQGDPCTTAIGEGASGHFVKMVHNGIEYGILQGIAELYKMMKFNGFTNEHIKNVFEKINTGKLECYLLEITTKIFDLKTEEGEDLIDKVSDRAESKGTGTWTIEAALELGVAVPTLAEAVFARLTSTRNQTFGCNYSSLKSKRQFLIGETTDIKVDIDLFKELLEMFSKVCYLQGLDLIVHADLKYKWNINILEVIRIWEGGCIIRSQLLKDIMNYYNGKKQLTLQDVSQRYLNNSYEFDLIIGGVINSSINYIFDVCEDKLPTNLIQLQRDYFGAHGFLREDKIGRFHLFEE